MGAALSKLRALRRNRTETSQTVAKPARRPCFEALEPRLLLDATLVINEFMASNGDSLVDGDGDYPDWVEIYNAGENDVDLDGWHLTDDDGNLDKWAFPAVSLPADSYLIVFASDKGASGPAGELHTDFKLSKDGEYLALVRPDGVTVEHEYAPEYPAQFRDMSYGVVRNTETLVADGAPSRLKVPGDDSDGTDWQAALGFDDSAWSDATASVGFDAAGDYASYINTDLTDDMQGINSSVYLRIPFTLDGDAPVESLTLKARFDDGFAAYLNGEAAADANAPAVPAWDSAATATHPDGEAIAWQAFDLGHRIDDLAAGDNLLAVQAMNASPDDADSDFLYSVELEAVRLLTSYLSEPTPGAANADPVDLSAVEASPGRGLYTDPVQVTLQSDTSGVEIRYTTDFSEPDESSALYTGPLTIDDTTVIRAVAFKDNYIPSKITTHTYIFPASVIDQPSNPPGFPTTWKKYDGSTIDADYAMRDSIVADYGDDNMTNWLSSLPTMSLSSDTDGIFDATEGIYCNPFERGMAWERAASAELIYPD
ncbi:MAG: chitobiase/beta-hexosaminidase C-terminal domain-containing protein, partial [Phycisphaerae bacterium]|nr:chitobiase/beta-hexosaminidase C-terminal domain-containing protein [Phycisphaerae bacterium]